jgi:predicted metal-dependent phosphoesterase TrpH
VAVALVARARAEGQKIALIVGEEISTNEGHLVGIGLTALVPPGTSMAGAIAAVHRQGGLAIVAHPLLPTRIAAPADLLIELYEGDRRFRPDALEAMNAMAAWVPGWRGRVERLAVRYDYAVTGGSDAHVGRAVGRCWTEFPGTDIADLYAAIRGRQTRPAGRAHPFGDIAHGALDQLTSGALSLRR